MPTYDYKCAACDDRFEVVQSMKDEPLETCEKCGGSVKRLIGNGGGIIFKGSGFYVNDYKKGIAPTPSAPSPACGSCAGSGGSCPAVAGAD